MIRAFINFNKKISQAFDTLLPAQMLEFGTGYLDTELMPRLVKSDITVMDIGGGKNPNISIEEKQEKNIRYIGIDIDAKELNRAPVGQYDNIIVADICKGADTSEKADLIIARALMEHVPDTKGALDTMSALLNPSGKVMIFVPCKYAWFTLINRILPEKLKVKLLTLCFPEKMHRLGFKAFYDGCSPSEMVRNAKAAGLEVQELKLFYASRYFEVFFPLHIIWRIYQVIIRALGIKNLCETFTLVLKKP